jgi:hypothetical protein
MCASGLSLREINSEAIFQLNAYLKHFVKTIIQENLSAAVNRYK